MSHASAVREYKFCVAYAKIMIFNPAIIDQQMTAEIYPVSPSTHHILPNTSQGLNPLLPCDPAMNDLGPIRTGGRSVVRAVDCGNFKLDDSVIYSIHFNVCGIRRTLITDDACIWCIGHVQFKLIGRGR